MHQGAKGGRVGTVVGGGLVVGEVVGNANGHTATESKNSFRLAKIIIFASQNYSQHRAKIPLPSP